MNLEDFVRDLNQTWLSQDMDKLRGFFHEEVVMFLPNGLPAMQSSEAMVASYIDFIESANIYSFEIQSIETHQFGEIAFCHLHFEVDYEYESRRFKEKGTDIYAIKLSPTPKVVWRTQLTHQPDPSTQE